MKHEFWHEKWKANELGFHQKEAHPLLKRYWSELSLAENSKILAPLCGKSNDLLWLEQASHRVLGAELSQIAVEAFFAENSLAVEQKVETGFSRYHSGRIDLLCGDFFSLNQGISGEINGVFDRAALVALPEAMRREYVKKIRELTGPGVRILLVTVNYETQEINPPPFSIAEEEVRALYQDWCDIKVLGETEAELKNCTVLEIAYQLTVK